MNKSAKLLSLILSASLASQMISSVNISATKDSITFYDVKNNILDLKAYDAELDTNHDGNMNVFDVIRANKTLIQEESYTDLKEKVYMLETQIELLYKNLNEKTDAEEGKQLSSNDYTNEEKQKLEGLNNYDDAHIKSEVSELSDALSGKVDKEEGKQLSRNDYTDEEKQKLEGLNNYDDSKIKTEVAELSGTLSGKVDKEEGKQLSSNDYTDEEKQKLENLRNFDDTEIKSELQKQNDLIDSLVVIANEEKNKYDSLILDIVDSKVDKEEGKQLSSNDYTDKEKQKLESLNNYDDTVLKNEIKDAKNNISNIQNSQIYNNHISFDSDNRCIIKSKYNSNYDIAIVIGHNGANELIDFNKVYLVDNTGKLNDDTNVSRYIISAVGDMFAPQIIMACDNVDGEHPELEYYTGGNHLDNDTSQGGAKTARNISFNVYADNILVSDTDSLFCNKVTLTWTNYIQAYNTTKSDGGGREVLREDIKLEIVGSYIDISIKHTALENIIRKTYYGLQMMSSCFDSVRFVGGTNRLSYKTNDSVNCGGKECREMVFCTSLSDLCYVGIKDIDLGSFDYSGVSYSCFNENYGKAYYNIINNGGFEQKANEITEIRGYYIFSSY